MGKVSLVIGTVQVLPFPFPGKPPDAKKRSPNNQFVLTLQSIDAVEVRHHGQET